MLVRRSGSSENVPALAIAFNCFIIASLCFSATASPQSTTSKSPSLAASSSHRDAPRTNTSDAEALKHYKVAQAAIADNDLATGEKELQAACAHSRRGNYFFTLAQVEFKLNKLDDANTAIAKAAALGLARDVKDEADDLQGKITYALQKQRQAEEISKHIEDRLRSFVGTWTGDEVRDLDYTVTLQVFSNPMGAARIEILGATDSADRFNYHWSGNANISVDLKYDDQHSSESALRFNQVGQWECTGSLSSRYGSTEDYCAKTAHGYFRNYNFAFSYVRLDGDGITWGGYAIAKPIKLTRVR